MKIDNDIVLNGPFSFQTVKTSKGKVRFVASVTSRGTDGKITRASVFGDWDGYLPENFKLVNEAGYRDAETGLIRSVSGALKGKVTIPAGSELVEKTIGSENVVIHEVELASPFGIEVEKTNQEFVQCTL